MYYLTWICARIFGLLPTGLVDFGAHTLAFFAFDVLRVRRSLILSNIRIAFPNISDSDAVRMGRASLYHFAATLFETIRGGNRDLLAQVSLKNREIMDHAMSEGKGVYLLCVHMGNFEALGGMISTTWKPATVPVKFLGRGGFDRYVHEQRCRYRIDPVRADGNVRRIVFMRRALTEGRPVGFMLDQARHGEPRLPLFGRPAKTNTSIAAIWRKNPAPLVPLFIRRISFGVHEVVFLPQVHLELTDDLEADVLRHATVFNGIVESIVRMYPEQYWWLHNRWK